MSKMKNSCACARMLTATQKANCWVKKKKKNSKRRYYGIPLNGRAQEGLKRLSRTLWIVKDPKELTSVPRTFSRNPKFEYLPWRVNG